MARPESAKGVLRSPVAERSAAVELRGVSKSYTRGNAATREIVGMRFGFDSIAGDIGLKLATLSGSMRIDGGAAAKPSQPGQPAPKGGA